MKDYKAVALALPTIVALTLGGVALTAAPALAEPAPIATTEAASAAPEDAIAADEGAGAPAVEVPAEAVEPEEAGEPDAVEPEESVDPEPGEAAEPEAVEPEEAAAPASEAPATGDAAAQVDAEPTEFSVTSPLDGAVLPSAGVVVTAEVPEGSAVRMSSSPDGGGRYEPSSGTSISQAFFLEASTVPVEHVVTVQVTSPDGRDLGSVQRRVVVPALAPLPAPVLVTPATGAAVVGVPYSSGDFSTGAIELSGTGAPGAVIDVDLLALDPVVPWGYDDEAPLVAADGSWQDVVWMPYGSWRVSAAQQSVDANGFATSLRSTFDSIDVLVVEPDTAPAAPASPAVLPVVETTAVVPVVPARSVVPSLPRALASTGTDEATPWAGLVGTGLVLLGGASLVVARRARRA
ncbi:LPXTG cell wall anchor domain-containing protein [Frigoribacterium sp. VKM Ac-2530]|uniref:LPXTG cell wall anchor domain-containing protein n=1 Tax=Frigoribacterium sp. VKM Ac-2530 TaxID=2783822 RepID=UPI00188D48DC|nr:LPXTG cell wall anchor domain-containing protein [Frigoribacterium sp. VKM Ac-2530]MBF4579815.1 LPXTG cell wall anchor domain-containing protein [Frigoribacterium sp. VKM Ac-2530]